MICTDCHEVVEEGHTERECIDALVKRGHKMDRARSRLVVAAHSIAFYEAEHPGQMDRGLVDALMNAADAVEDDVDGVVIEDS
ncbi:MAG: hypothetical protein ACYDH4_11470 [Candidatus Cryosericum sp.]